MCRLMCSNQIYSYVDSRETWSETASVHDQIIFSGSRRNEESARSVRLGAGDDLAVLLQVHVGTGYGRSHPVEDRTPTLETRIVG